MFMPAMLLGVVWWKEILTIFVLRNMEMTLIVRGGSKLIEDAPTCGSGSLLFCRTPSTSTPIQQYQMTQTNNTPPTQPDAQQPTDEGLDDAICSPSFDPKEDNECTLQRHKDGRLEILSAPPVFVCARESIEDLLARHNKLIEQRDEARKTAAELRDLVPWDEVEPWTFDWENKDYPHKSVGEK
jgi:hypothetical protein